MAAEIVYCINGHVIDGIAPMLDETKFEVQHPELIGKVCDCKKVKFNEGRCPTCSGEKWRIKWEENNG